MHLPVLIGDDEAATRVERFAAIAGPVDKLLAIAGKAEEGGAAAKAAGAIALGAEKAWSCDDPASLVSPGRGLLPSLLATAGWLLIFVCVLPRSARVAPRIHSAMPT